MVIHPKYTVEQDNNNDRMEKAALELVERFNNVIIMNKYIDRKSKGFCGPAFRPTYRFYFQLAMDQEESSWKLQTDHYDDTGCWTDLNRDNKYLIAEVTQNGFFTTFHQNHWEIVSTLMKDYYYPILKYTQSTVGSTYKPTVIKYRNERIAEQKQEFDSQELNNFAKKLEALGEHIRDSKEYTPEMIATLVRESNTIEINEVALLFPDFVQPIEIEPEEVMEPLISTERIEPSV